MLEFSHEPRLFRAFGFALAHPGIEIMNDPVVGKRHVAGERLAVDQGDAVLAEHPVGSAIVDERGDREFALWPLLQIVGDRRRTVELVEAIAGMRAGRTYDDRK